MRAAGELDVRALGARFKRNATSYLEVFSGTFGRLALQAVYFLALANTLSIPELGAFAAISATGIMIGCFSGLGFSSLAFRAAAGRHRLLGGYLSWFFVLVTATTPLALAISLPFYFYLFKDSLSLLAFVEIIVVEVFLWRLIDAMHQINNGLGRFAAASILLIMATAARTAAAVTLAVTGEHSLETWALLYICVNSVAAALALTIYRPKVRLRWRTELLFGRMKEAMLFAFVNFTSDMQKEIDKLILVTLVDERAVGIYAISMRIVELATVPIKTFYILYSRRLIKRKFKDRIIMRNFPIELGIGFVSLATYAAFLIATNLLPGVLGENISIARELYGSMLLVPVFKNMMDLHSELFFAYRRMTERAFLLIFLIALKSAALVVMVRYVPGPEQWGHWLELIFGILYVISAGATYYSITRPGRTR